VMKQAKYTDMCTPHGTTQQGWKYLNVVNIIWQMVYWRTNEKDNIFTGADNTDVVER